MALYAPVGSLSLLATQEPPILCVPIEVAQRIVLALSPRDVARLAQVCQSFYSLIYNASDRHIWRSLFLTHFDDPRLVLGLGSVPDGRDFDWRHELERRVRAETVAFCSQEYIPTEDERVAALSTFIDAIFTTSPLIHDKKNIQWLNKIFHEPHLRRRALVGPSCSLSERLFAQLATYQCALPDPTTRRRLEARAFTYDMRKYGAANNWGPFIASGPRRGHVDWVHMEHLQVVVACNIEERVTDWSYLGPPIGFAASTLHSTPGPWRALEEDENGIFRKVPKPGPYRDWAGIEGTWRRLVCFMDYRDLYQYNYASVASNAYDESIFEDPDFEEALRPVDLEFRIIGSEDDLSGDNERPRLIFTGSSPSLDATAPQRIIEGRVSSTPDGHVQWSFTTSYAGQLWSSEGIQIGAAGSAAGVLGVWTAQQHEEGDPAGPFWMWKLSETFGGGIYH